MLISITELKEMKEFANIPLDTLKRKINAVEIAIRQTTNNNFQNRLKRIVASSSGNVLNSTSPYFKVGDTIQISESINDGLYVIEEITENTIKLDKDIFDSEHNLCTKIEYPADIIEGAIKLLDWDIKNGDKTGIASETISRHSVTYQTLDANNTVNGYPASLFGFCKKYQKARF